MTVGEFGYRRAQLCPAVQCGQAEAVVIQVVTHGQDTVGEVARGLIALYVGGEQPTPRVSARRGLRLTPCGSRWATPASLTGRAVRGAYPGVKRHPTG